MASAVSNAASGSKPVSANDCTASDATERAVPSTQLVKMWSRGLRKGAKSALYAAAFRTAFGIVKVLLKRRLAAGLVTRLANETITLNPLKWATIFGSFALYAPLMASWEAAVSAIGGSALAQHPAIVAAGAALAGGTVAQSVRVMDVTTRTELALYLAVRAVHGRLVAHILPNLPEPLRTFEHYDALTMSLTGSQILYSIVWAPLSHSSTYLDFLQRCTMLSPVQHQAIASFHRAQPTPGLALAFARTPALRNTPPSVEHLPDICKVTHFNPQDSCNVNLAKWTVKHLLGFSLPMYAPLKITAAVATNARGLRKNPMSFVTKLAKSILVSSLFLTVYCAGALRSVCFTAQHGARGGYKVAAVTTLACAGATMIEPKGRRLDLALYCATHAIRSMYLTLHHRGWVQRPNRAMLLQLYVAAIISLLHQYTTQRDTLNAKLRKGFSWIL